MRRERLIANGAEDFLFVRAIDDMIDRLFSVRRRFDRVLLAGCPSPGVACRLREQFPDADIIEPAPALAARMSATTGSDVRLDVTPGSYDLVLSLNSLAESDDPLETLMRFRFALAEGGLLMGATSGGATLPLLRSVMASADAATGKATARFHPRIDPAALTQLLTKAGLSEAVVDVDRIDVRYGELARLLGDLRGMAATNFLAKRSRRPIPRRSLSAAFEAFAIARDEDGKATETFEIVHFSGWA